MRHTTLLLTLLFASLRAAGAEDNIQLGDRLSACLPDVVAPVAYLKSLR